MSGCTLFGSGSRDRLGRAIRDWSNSGGTRGPAWAGNGNVTRYVTEAGGGRAAVRDWSKPRGDVRRTARSRLLQGRIEVQV